MGRSRERSLTTDHAVVAVGPLSEVAVAKNLLRLRFCLICHNEMTDEICCTCEAPTVLKTSP
jgi:hypothetical protein